MAMERDEKNFLRALSYALGTFGVMSWALWLLAPDQPAPAPTATPVASAAERREAPPSAAVPLEPTFSASATYPPLVENGFEVVGPTSRKPADPAPGQRYLDTTLNTYSIFNGSSWQAVNTSAGIGVLDDISDVSAVSPALGEFLGWNGSAWSNLTLSLSTLTDAEITSASPGQSLRFNGSNFVNAALGVDDISEIVIGAWETGETLRWNGSNLVDSKLSLYDLSNLNVSTPANGQVLAYDSGTSKWVNSTLSVSTSLDGLSDVVITAAASGDFLGYNGTNWVDTTISLDTLSDVAITSAATGEVLRYNGTNFVDAVLDIDDLANVTITAWATGEVPRWNGTALVDATLSVDDLSEVTIGTWASGETLRWNGSALVDSKLAMNDLSDVNLTSLADNQFLRWDGGTSKVVNETVDVPADWNCFVVTEYGAIGDGTTNDTTAINNAIIAAEAVGGGAKVILPRGTYGVTGLLQAVTGDIQIIGQGAVIKQLASNATNQILYVGGNDVLVQGVEFDGNFPTVKGGTYNAGDAQGGSSSTIQLALAASSGDDTYNGTIVEITSGTGSGQWRFIYDYTGSNRTATVSPNWTITPDSMSDYTVYSGDGIGINILASNVEVKDCYIHHTKGEGIASQTGSSVIRATNTRVISPGEGGMHLKGDEVYVHGCRVENWNSVSAFSGIRALEFDSQEADAESIEVFDTNLVLDTDTSFTDGILIDAGDNNLTSGDSAKTPFGSSGAAIEDGDDSAGALKSYAQFTLDAGHGFQVGDSIWIDDNSLYDGVSHAGKSHAIRSIGGTGNVYARVESTTTLSLYKNAAAARTGGATDKVILTDDGTGTTYISATRAGRTTIASVDESPGTSTITTAAAHGFITGEMVRLTQGSGATVMPGGLVNAGTITLTTLYAGAGTGVGTYMRPKRVRNVTLRNVTVDWHPSDSADCNGIKINNAENVVLDRVIVNEPPEYGSDIACSIRLGQGLRKVSMTGCRTTGSLLNNPIAFIPELDIDRCEIGGGANLPQNAITTLAVGRLSIQRSTLRTKFCAIDVAELDYLRDDDIVEWVITDNILEFNPAGDTRCRVFDVSDNAQLVNSRKVRYFNNERRNVGAYTGLSISSLNTTSEVITMSTHHQLETGDMVKMESSSAPGGTTDEAWYFIRKTGDTTLKLYASVADAFADTSPINLSSSGSGSKLWSPKIGVQFSNNGNRDYLFWQKNASAREFVSVAAPSGTTIAYNAGDIVWAMNPVRDDSPGWYCTASGLVGASVGTFVAMPALAPTNPLAVNVTEVGNVTAGEDDLITYSLPANTLNEAGASLEIEAGYSFAANGNNKTIKLYIGSADVLAIGAAAQNGGSYVARATVTRDTSSTGKLGVTGGAYSLSGTPLETILGRVYPVHSLDFTNTLTIKGTGESGSSATNDVVMEYLRVKYIPPP